MQKDRASIIREAFDKNPQAFMENCVIYGTELFHELLVAVYREEAPPPIPPDVAESIAILEGPPCQAQRTLRETISGLLPRYWVSHLIQQGKSLDDEIAAAKDAGYDELVELLIDAKREQDEKTDEKNRSVSE